MRHNHRHLLRVLLNALIRLPTDSPPLLIASKSCFEMYMFLGDDKQATVSKVDLEPYLKSERNLFLFLCLILRRY